MMRVLSFGSVGLALGSSVSYDDSGIRIFNDDCLLEIPMPAGYRDFVTSDSHQVISATSPCIDMKHEPGRTEARSPIKGASYVKELAEDPNWGKLLGPRSWLGKPELEHQEGRTVFRCVNNPLSSEEASAVRTSTGSTNNSLILKALWDKLEFADLESKHPIAIYTTASTADNVNPDNYHSTKLFKNLMLTKLYLAVAPEDPTERTYAKFCNALLHRRQRVYEALFFQSPWVSLNDSDPVTPMDGWNQSLLAEFTTLMVNSPEYLLMNAAVFRSLRSTLWLSMKGKLFSPGAFKNALDLARNIQCPRPLDRCCRVIGKEEHCLVIRPEKALWGASHPSDTLIA